LIILTQTYHPDKYKGDLSRDQVDDKMSKINLANEILSNPELRQRYDSGDDPNEQQGHNPFGSGFGNGFQGFKFQGGHQHFQFNF
jgi:DnaJ homolog subfamily C member 3